VAAGAMQTGRTSGMGRADRQARVQVIVGGSSQGKCANPDRCDEQRRRRRGGITGAVTLGILVYSFGAVLFD